MPQGKMAHMDCAADSRGDRASLGQRNSDECTVMLNKSQVSVPGLVVM